MAEKLVLFDVDHTLAKIDGHDYMSQLKDPETQGTIEDLTRRAMANEVPFEESIRAKITLLSPSQKELDFLASSYLDNLTEDAEAVIRCLQKSGYQIGFLSGNFYSALLPLAEKLGVDPQNIYSNHVYVTDDGKYNGFDEKNPLLTDGGKGKVVEQLRPRYRKIFMVGDGPVDLATKPHVDLFIGFGGVTRRQIVENEADVYITDPSLAPILCEILPHHRRFMRRIMRDPAMRKARALRR